MAAEEPSTAGGVGGRHHPSTGPSPPGSRTSTAPTVVDPSTTDLSKKQNLTERSGRIRHLLAACNYPSTVIRNCAQTWKVATTAAWSDGAEVCGVGSSVIDGSGLAATISTAGMLSGLTSRWEANMWSMSSPRPR